MHTIDLFQMYNLLAGGLSAAGFLYLLLHNRPINSYHRSVQVLVLGLLVFAIGGPIVDLANPTWSHGIHVLSATLVIFGLYNPVRNDLRREQWANLILRDPRKIRHAAEWMVPMDDEILEVFHNTELVLTPSIVAYNIGYSREEVNRRLRELTDNGLINRVERGKYRITELGNGYLSGESVVDGRNYAEDPQSH